MLSSGIGSSMTTTTNTLSMQTSSTINTDSVIENEIYQINVCDGDDESTTISDELFAARHVLSEQITTYDNNDA